MTNGPLGHDCAADVAHRAAAASCLSSRGDMIDLRGEDPIMSVKLQHQKGKVLACCAAALKLKYRSWSAGNCECTDFEHLCERASL